MKNGDEQFIEEMVDHLKKGKVIIMPGEVGYLLACDFSNKKAMERIYEIKSRPASKKFPLFIPSIEYLDVLGITTTPLEKKFMHRYWPNPLFIAFSPQIAARIPTSDWLQKVTARVGAIAASSANRSGQPEVNRAKDLDRGIVNEADKLFADDEKVIFPKVSSIVRLKDTVEVLREGSVKKEDLLSFANAMHPID